MRITRNHRLLFLAFLIVCVGFLFLPSGRTTTIEMTDQGFYPSEVTIKQGDTVLFKSTGELAHWPASNFHPTHTMYPGSDIRACGTISQSLLFDACDVVEPGEEYRFTFHEAGVWNFHDHVDPRYSGRIVVQEREWYVRPVLHYATRFLSEIVSLLGQQNTPETLRDIRGLSSLRADARGLIVGETLSYDDLTSSKEYERESIFHYTFDDVELRRVVYQLGVKRTMEKILEESGGGGSFDCHIAAHYVGRAAYDVFGESSLTECDSSCHSGCYHGAMEALFWEAGAANLMTSIENACATFDSEFGKIQCYHGAGHGFMALGNYDLPQALSRCDEFERSGATSSCYSGVFMENIVTGAGLGAGLKNHSTPWLSLSDMNFPCNTLDDNVTAQKKCYGMQTSWMFILASNDAEQVADACRAAPETMVNECFRSFGRDIAGNSLRDAHDVASLCALAPDASYSSCIVGGTGVVIDFWGEELNDQASSFCDALDTTSAKDACYGYLTERLPEIFPQRTRQEQICRSMSAPYDEACLRVTRSS